MATTLNDNFIPTPKPLTRDNAPGKFGPAFDFVEQLSTELGHKVSLAGGAIRDIYFDVEPKDWDIWVSVGSRSSFDLVSTLINKIYFTVGAPAIDITQLSTNQPAGTYNAFQAGMNVKSAGYFLFGEKLVNIIVCDRFAIDSFDFDVNMGYVYDGQLHGLDKLNAAAVGEGIFALTTTAITSDSVEHFTKRAEYIAERTGLRLSDDSAKQLAKFDTTKLKKVTKLTGYRTFNIGADTAGLPVLFSPSQGDKWESKSLLAKCDTGDVITHLLKQEHLCGINMFNEVIQSGYERHHVVAEVEPMGIVRVLDEGMRSEEAVITQLWIIRENIISDMLSYNKGVTRHSTPMDLPSPTNNKRLLVADQLQERYGVPVNVTDKQAIKAIVSARAGRIKI